VDLPDILPDSEVITSTADWLMLALQILMIILLAVVLRWLAHRTIRRLTLTTAGAAPTVLKPLRERAPTMLAEAASLLSERRRQRAEAIGSMLRNFSSVVIFTVALLMILDELGLDLAPLLASAGIAGVALGFGAQYLVRDVISGLSMIIEDQYGVGDTVDLGEASGVVESVGLRVTTVRDVRGVVWYVRNGEVIRVGNKSQGWARVVIDLPIGLGTPIQEAVSVIHTAVAEVAAEPEVAERLIEDPEVWGVEDVTVEGAVVRLAVKTAADAQWDVARRIRRHVVDALTTAGITARIASTRVFVPRAEGDGGTSGAAGDGGGTGNS
jgi:small conductance mechanosensitive channel